MADMTGPAVPWGGVADVVADRTLACCRKRAVGGRGGWWARQGLGNVRWLPSRLRRCGWFALLRKHLDYASIEESQLRLSPGVVCSATPLAVMSGPSLVARGFRLVPAGLL